MIALRRPLFIEVASYYEVIDDHRGVQLARQNVYWVGLEDKTCGLNAFDQGCSASFLCYPCWNNVFGRHLQITIEEMAGVLHPVTH